MKKPVMVHHKAALSGQFPPNSLETIRACLEAKAAFIEVDIVALAKDDYLLVHDDRLEAETTGSGPVAGTLPEQIAPLFIKHRDVVSAYQPALLRDVVNLFREYPQDTRLQLDYKNVLPMATLEPIERLVNIIQPLGDRVIVSSGADWQLRRMRKLAPWLDSGFDVQFYLDWRAPGQTIDPRIPPFRQGVYGYYDDHLLATQAVWSTPEYLAERYEIITRLVPGVSTFYIDHRMLVKHLDDGFDTADFLHSLNIQLDSWTLDADKPVAVTNAKRLAATGLDLLTTNTPVEMAALFN